MRPLRWSAAFALLPVFGPAGAQPAPILPECTCRANGEHFHLGDGICLKTANGYRIAECELTQNITNWRFSNVGCQISGLWIPSGKPVQMAYLCRGARLHP